MPYLNQERDQPRYTQVIAGITIGPTDNRQSTHNCSSPPEAIQLSEARDEWLDLSTGKFREGGTVERSEAIVCDETVLATELDWTIPPDPSQRFLGASVTMFKARATPAVSTSIPAARWSEGSVAGHAAAIASPLLDNGFGNAAVVVYVDGILLSVNSDGLTIDEVIAIAEDQLQ